MVRRTADSGRDENAKWCGKNLFHVPENAERKIFRFGARKEKKSNQNEKNLGRKFWFCGVRIEGVAVPKLLWQVSAVSDSPFLFP